MKIQETLKKAGYSFSDNRSLNFRNINKAIDYGIIIAVVDLGYLKTSKKGYNLNVCYQFKNKDNDGFVTSYRRFNISRKICAKWESADADIIGETILQGIIDFRKHLISQNVFDVLSISKEKGMCKCEKCNGKGIIPAFMHYCNGVCFDCIGLGYGKQGKHY